MALTVGNGNYSYSYRIPFEMFRKLLRLHVVGLNAAPRATRRGKSYGASAPMRWALAMTLKVIVVAGIDGRTEASTM
jgi:hypothetical protein